MNYGRLIEMYERLPIEDANDRLKQMFESKDVRPTEFDLGALFAEAFGWQEFGACRSKKRMIGEVLLESQGAVTSAAFTNITGQIVYSAILEPYKAEEFVFTQMIPEVDTKFLDGEKMAGINEIGDEIQIRGETFPYAVAGVSEDWIFTPSIPDRGVVVPVTWEAVFQDRTGRVLEECAKVGLSGGRNREKRAIDAVIDENTTRHRYNWRGTVIATYGDNSGTHTWDNLTASNALVDWTDLDNSEQTHNAIVNPYTGEPIDIELTDFIVTKQLEQTARRIVSATEIRVITPGYATTGNPTQTNQANPYNNKYKVVTSKLLAQRLGTDTSWFLGNIAKAVRAMVAEKPDVVEAPPNNHDEFWRRIVKQYRFNERVEYVVVQPRALQKNTA